MKFSDWESCPDSVLVKGLADWFNGWIFLTPLHNTMAEMWSLEVAM